MLAVPTETVFVDRSLGASVVPDGLRAAGLTIVTMREHYGEAAGARVADVEWIEMATRSGWLVFHKDADIRRRLDERRAVVENSGRMFCIANTNVSGAEILRRYLGAMPAITAATPEPGPYIYSVEATRMRRLLP